VSFAKFCEGIDYSERTGRQTDSYNKSNWCLVLLIERKGVFLTERKGVFRIERKSVFLIERKSVFLIERKGLFLIERKGLFLIERKGVFLIERKGVFPALAATGGGNAICHKFFSNIFYI
jgi:hypothetical protein